VKCALRGMAASKNSECQYLHTFSDGTHTHRHIHTPNCKATLSAMGNVDRILKREYANYYCMHNFWPPKFHYFNGSFE
jgi:hypothetical protein